MTIRRRQAPRQHDTPTPQSPKGMRTMTASPAFETPGLHPAHTRRQYDLLFGHAAAAFPADAVITLAQPVGDYERHTHVPMSDAAEFVATAQRLGATERLNLCLAPRALTALERRAEAEGKRGPDALRGRADECYASTMIGLDIDFRSARHASAGLPTESQARDLLADLPLVPGLVVATGGGFHAYLLLQSSLTGDARLDAFLRVKHWLVSYCAERGFEPDTASLKTAASLRVAGVIRGKGGPDHNDATPIESDSGERHTYAEICEAFEAAPAPNRSRTAGRASRGGTYADGIDLADDAEDTRPGTRFAARYPVARMLVEVFGCEERSNLKFAFPREDGTVNTSDIHCEVVDDDRTFETTGVIVYGGRWATEAGVETGKFYTSFELLGKVICGANEGAWSLAARVAKCVLDGSDDVEDALAELDEVLRSAWEDRVHSVEILTEVYGSKVTAPTFTQEGATVTHIGLAAAQSEPASAVAAEIPSVDLSDLAALPREPVEVRFPDEEMTVFVGGQRHGLWALVPSFDTNGNLSGHRPGACIVPWVALRAVKHVERGRDDESTFDVRVMTRNGQTFTLKEMSARDSLDPAKVAEKANTVGRGIKIPDQREKPVVANMLAKLGADTRREDEIIRRTGWIVASDQTHRFLGSVSSMACFGPTDDALAALPDGSNGTGIRPVIDAVGWEQLPNHPREAALAVEGLINVAPGVRGLGIAMLGLFAAALTGCDERTTLVLSAESGAGKSQVASCLTPFYSLAERSASAPPVDLEKDSAAFAFSLLRWCAYLPVWLDDARINTESTRKAEASAGLIGDLTQAAFNGASGGRGTGSGGVRAQALVQSPALMTAERLPAQTAIVNRGLVVALKKGDVDLDANAGQGLSGLDAFTAEFANTGLANQFGAVLIAHVARHLDERGALAPEATVRRFTVAKVEAPALAALAAWAKDRRRAYMTEFAVDRAAGNAAYLRMGWDVIYSCAEENGFTDLLPTPEEVDRELQALVVETRSSSSETDPGLRYVQAAARFVEGGQGHIVSSALAKPADHLSRGWRQRSGGAGKEADPQGARVGILSGDGRFIVLTNSGLRAAAKALDPQLLAYSNVELDKFVRKHCAAEMMPPATARDAKCSSLLGITPRPRGYVIPLGLFDGDDAVESLPALSRAVAAPSRVAASAEPVKPVAKAPAVAFAPPAPLAEGAQCTECQKGVMVAHRCGACGYMDDF